MFIKRLLIEFHPIVYVLVCGSVFMNIGFGLIVPYFAIYIGTFAKLDATAVGFIVGGASIGNMVGGFLGGALSDLFGRKKMMIMSLVISSFLYLGLVIHSLAFLMIILTLVKGFTMSFFDPCAKALIADFTDKNKRLRAFSLRYFAVNLGFAIGPILGFWLGITDKSTLPFVITFFILFFYAIVLQFLFSKYRIKEVVVDSEKVTIIKSLKEVSKNRVLLLFLLGGLLATTVHGQFSIVLSQYFERDFTPGLKYLLFLWSVHSIVIILFSFPITRMVERMRSIQSIKYGTLLFAIGIMGFSFSFNFWTFCVSMAIFTIGEVFLLPAEYAIIDEITPETMRGTYYGAASLTSIGSFIGPGISGFILITYGGDIMFYTLSIISLTSILFYYSGDKTKMKRYDNQRKYGIM